MRYPDYIKKLFKCFPHGFLNSHNDFIIRTKGNVYINLDSVQSFEDVIVKILEYCSRDASKGMPYKSMINNERFRAGLQYDFENLIGKRFTQKDWDAIYCRLGNGINHELALRFYARNFDMRVLKDDCMCNSGCNKCFEED